MHSLFEEQINLESKQLDHYLDYFTDATPEALTFYPAQKDFNVGPDEYLDNIRKAKAAVKMPIIGSLNGVTTGGWISYATEIEQAGADALELNAYYVATDPATDSAKVENMVVDVLKAVKKTRAHPCRREAQPLLQLDGAPGAHLAANGANGLVLFNRFYQPDLDLENLEVVPTLNLSTSDELRLPLRWIAILYGRVSADLALTRASTPIRMCSRA